MGCKNSRALPPVTEKTPLEVKVQRLCRDPRCAHLPGHYTTQVCGGEYRMRSWSDDDVWVRCEHYVCENAESQCACPSRKLCCTCFNKRKRFYAERDGTISPAIDNGITGRRVHCRKCPWSDHMEYRVLAASMAEEHKNAIREADGLPPAYDGTSKA